MPQGTVSFILMDLLFGKSIILFCLPVNEKRDWNNFISVLTGKEFCNDESECFELVEEVYTLLVWRQSKN